MIERKIKELSIALEALSRIQGYEVARHFSNVSDLLEKEIKTAQEQQKQDEIVETSPPKPSRTDDDDIPF